MFNPEEHIIFECISGSRLYGTSIESSDTDYRGVCKVPIKDVVSPFDHFEQMEYAGDRVIYGLGKFFQLCSQCNPNIVELLFAPPIKSSPEWELICENRDAFISKSAKHTFLGYAVAQIGKLKNHRAWLENPPEEPQRKDFGLSVNPIISGDRINAVLQLPADMVSPQYREAAINEKRYRDVLQDFNNYRTWMSSITARKQKEIDIGYDAKFAMHTYRLLTEGEQLLTRERIDFPLENREFLLDVRAGKYSYEKIMEDFSDVGNKFSELAKNSNLPAKPSINMLRHIFLRIYEIGGK